MVIGNDTNPREFIEKNSFIFRNNLITNSTSLKIKNLKGGFGINIDFKNTGQTDISNIMVNVNVSGGLFIRNPEKYYEISLISAGETITQKIKINGLGLGLLADIPKLTITISSVDIKDFKIRAIARIIGPLVKTVGDYWYINDTIEGYTLFSPMVSTSTYLLDGNREIVHTWESSFIPRISVYLLENGNILRPGDLIPNQVFVLGGGTGGNVEIIDWNGTVVWDYEYSTDLYCLHHDVEMLPNGNVLMIAYELKTVSEAVVAGRDPAFIPSNQIWPDHIIEVEPDGLNGGNIVWEWHVWDHLIQDFDSTKENYGVVEDHPELIDINYWINTGCDWIHANGIDYNEDLDQIIITSHGFSEFWVIDHSTTIGEAAGHIGGNSGKGGDLLYRWGNPQAYRAGDSSDQKLFRPHDAQWIEKDCPGEGNILVFNNGLGRPEGGYSSVEEIVPPINNNGNYNLTLGDAYGPDEPVWIYTADNPSDFFAFNLAGAQRLEDGNTLICSGPHGIFFEVTMENEIVWEYLNTIPNLIDNHVFKIKRYSPDYPGLENLFD